jgi:hypothetical protein
VPQLFLNRHHPVQAFSVLGTWLTNTQFGNRLSVSSLWSSVQVLLDSFLRICLGQEWYSDPHWAYVLKMSAKAGVRLDNWRSLGWLSSHSGQNKAAMRIAALTIFWLLPDSFFMTVAESILRDVQNLPLRERLKSRGTFAS